MGIGAPRKRALRKAAADRTDTSNAEASLYAGARRLLRQARKIRLTHRRANMRNIVDENWRRLKHRLRDFWNALSGEKRTQKPLT
jgi:hypothetical protein